jgi:replicative DNA helicase
VLQIAHELEEPVHEELEYVTSDLGQILAATTGVRGLRWRLPWLNKSLGSLRRGDFGFVFARPETGKTTFLASEVTYMAEQAKGSILWFNNEEQGAKVKLRCYQAALGANLSQLRKHPERAETAYRNATGDRIRIVDDVGLSARKCEQIVAREQPSLIVFDQIDKVKGFKNDREDLAMGAIYQWARELAKQYSPIIGVCQASGEAEGEPYLHMGHVSNARTAKQAEADFILGIGKTHQSGHDFLRYFNISKNKLVGDEDSDPSMRHGRQQILIQPEIARYTEVM